jgi:acetyl esterase/lipase
MKPIVFFLLMASLQLNAQETIPLYPGPIPGAIDKPDAETTNTLENGVVIVGKISRPTVTVYKGEDVRGRTGKQTAIIIFPGGGYVINALKHEGHDVGRWLAQHGITAFVVKYRVPDSTYMTNPSTAPLQDAQQAIGWVRENAKKYGIDKNKIGVLGFSAGGHLAASASTHYKTHLTKYKKVRPDFSVLIYPVISFTDSIGHKGSRYALLGKQPTQEAIKAWSNEFQVNAKTPPAFLAHAKDDWVNYKNSVMYAEALRAHQVKAELLLFPDGGHGFGMTNAKGGKQWPDELLLWLSEFNKF